MSFIPGETVHGPSSEEWPGSPNPARMSWDDESLRHIPNPLSGARTTDPEAAIEYAELKAVIDEQLSALGPRAADVLRRLHGLNEYGEPQSYEEVAKAHDTTPHGAKIIATYALRTLRNSVLPDSLARYLEDDPTPTAQEPTPSKCEDIFAGIAVPLHDEYDPRPYNVRLKETCDKWLAEQLIGPKEYISGYSYNQITTSLVPDGMYIHDRQIDTTDAAREHYRSALARIKGLMQSLKFFMHFNAAHPRAYTLENLLARGTLAHEDLPYVFDINLSDPKSREAAIAKRMRMTVPEVVAQLEAAKKTYDSYRRRLSNNPERFWRSDLPRITKLYDWDKVFALGVDRQSASCSTELSALLAAKERILRRPVVPGTEQTRAASLMVIDTKIRYYKRVAKTCNIQFGDKHLFALLPHYS